MYEWEGHYKAALTNYDLARDIAPHTADAYYARGGLYYELGLFDAVRRRRFDFDPNNLTARVYPDERTSVLMSLANEEYTEAERYPGFDDLVSLSVAAHRRSQIRAISGGSSYVGLHKLELLLLMPWVGNLFPDDRDLVARSRALALNLIHYMRDHPSEFPDVPQSMLPRPR